MAASTKICRIIMKYFQLRDQAKFQH